MKDQICCARASNTWAMSNHSTAFAKLAMPSSASVSEPKACNSMIKYVLIIAHYVHYLCQGMITF